MDLPNPDTVYALLVVLKDAGIACARFGDVEFEFAPPEVKPEPVGYQTQPKFPGRVVETVEGDEQPVDEVLPPGYAKLFNGKRPTFPGARS